MRVRFLLPASTAVLAGALTAACGGGGEAGAQPTVVHGTPTIVPAGSLTVTLEGQPDRSFIIAGGHWRVCQAGSVENLTEVAARDVRLSVTYVDHGAVVGGISPSTSAAAGGSLGDMAPGAQRPFRICGLATAEPDQVQVVAVPAAG